MLNRRTMVTGLFATLGTLVGARRSEAASDKDGYQVISPSLLAFSADICSRNPAFEFDTAGNLISRFSIQEASARIWRGATAQLLVRRAGAWVLLETVTMDRHGFAYFTPVSFTPELGDLQISQWWSNGRIEFLMTLDTTDHRGNPLHAEYPGEIYRCPTWRDYGCDQAGGGCA
ncbi:MAG TPA: hypothetical protein VFL82_09910 [Thermomicrobiales bacterium]|nr:hypothetical protein [Thermomicrobiales bacterium]